MAQVSTNTEMLEHVMLLKLRGVTFRTWLIVLALAIPLASCGKSEKTEKPSVKTFASPDEAGNSLLAAGKSGDQTELLAIFGPDSKEVIFSGDAVQDKGNAAKFIEGYELMHRWRQNAGWFPSPAGRDGQFCLSDPAEEE